MNRVYLDHNSTTPTAGEVVEAMLPFFGEVWGNPSSHHSYGREVKQALDRARENVAFMLGASSEEIIFTHSGTSSNNLAVKGIVKASNRKKKHIITSSIEHSSIYNCCKELEKYGCTLSELPVDSHGRIVSEKLPELITDDTVVISVMLANNETGTIQPLKEICDIASKYNIPVHTDAVQAAGKIHIDVDELGVDMLSISGHKIYGPKGTGALYIRKGLMLAPLHYGGTQESGKFPGTENVPGIVGLGKACEIAYCYIEHNIKHLSSLRNKLERKLFLKLPSSVINGHPELRLPNTVNVSFPGVANETIVTRLDNKGIAVSTGAACSSVPGKPSRVLQASGQSVINALSSIRISVGLGNTDQDIDRAIEELAEIISHERSFNR